MGRVVHTFQAIHDSKTHEPKPLLFLLRTAHPLIKNAIDVSLSMYSTSKNYSPRTKSSVEFIERYLTPFINIIGLVGRIFGVEDGVRRIFSRRRPGYHTRSHSDDGARSLKRRRKLNGDGDRREAYRNIATDQFHTSHQKNYRPRGGAGHGLIGSNSNGSQQNETPQFSTLQSQENETAEFIWSSTLYFLNTSPKIRSRTTDDRMLALEQLGCANQFVTQKLQELKEEITQHCLIFTFNEDVEFSVDDENFRLVRRIQEIKNDLVTTLGVIFRALSWYIRFILPSGSRILVRNLLISRPLLTRSYTGEHQDENSRWMYSATAGSILKFSNECLELSGEGMDVLCLISDLIRHTFRRRQRRVNAQNGVGA
ncbi:hypothetical protein K3495_g12329 [Podosphaera aphanis]|nr:hypothetical protein K3495_g12329 [Podosphaera aphanis]